MTVRRSAVRRGSQYTQAQLKKAVTIHIAYEGAVDEAEYFASLPNQIARRYQGLLKIIPITKSSTDAAPQKVRDDIINYMAKQGISRLKNTNSSDIIFMVIDKDNHFEGTHAQKNIEAINECIDKGIKVLCTAPCFELWLILHYLDVATCDASYKRDLLLNNKKNNRTFSKRAIKELRKGESFNDMQKKTLIALDNEAKLNSLAKSPKLRVPSELVSQVGDIFRTIDDIGAEMTFGKLNNKPQK